MRGRIDYGGGENGVLIYLKASMSGDESDYVIDYKRRNPTFPHETTVDQFFSEEQFEVYRALGFHACRNLFTGADAFATRSDLGPEWKKQVSEALALLTSRPRWQMPLSRITTRRRAAPAKMPKGKR